MHSAATKIQSLWRGYDLRLRLSYVLWRHWSVDTIQTCWRNYKRRQQAAKKRLRVLTQVEFEIQCNDIKRTALMMTMEEKQQLFVMLKEAVTTLKQRLDELREETYTVWITDIPGIMEELIKVDRTHDASCEALSAIITLIDVNHLHSPEMEAYHYLTGCDKHGVIYSQNFG